MLLLEGEGGKGGPSVCLSNTVHFMKFTSLYTLNPTFVLTLIYVIFDLNENKNSLPKILEFNIFQE